MKSVVMANFSQIWLPTTALILFLSVFVVMMIFIWRKSSSNIYKEVSKLPLDEGSKYE